MEIKNASNHELNHHSILMNEIEENQAKICQQNTLVERRKGTPLFLGSSIKNNHNKNNYDILSTPQNHHHHNNENQQIQQQQPTNYTSSILAQIERQNALLEKDPKSISIASNELKCHFSTVKKLVSDIHSPPPTAPIPGYYHHDHHYSNNNNNNNDDDLLVTNDWDFWQSLLQNPSHMTKKTPHLLSMKLQQGIPPHLRGHIWQTICQSDSLHLETVYSQLYKEHSPHERIIQRDLTRTFPNIDMFQQENGDGQLAMRRILIAYSLYDGQVGYCQGLAFLVGPLLMNMPETQAFCVFVRLMETYEMRTMFTLSMEGLQLRLYQFSSLLKEFLPNLSAHFEEHSIHAAMYASQWFLTLFAYAFPMDLVTRIYDIIFLEGAAETIMRVAIAMLQRSEHLILQEQEFEHLLDCVTTRKLCTPYQENWSLVIQETMSLSKAITTSKLDELTDQYNQQGQQEKKKTEQVLASRLGNFWRRNSTRNKNNNTTKQIKKTLHHPDRSSIAGHPIHSNHHHHSNNSNDMDDAEKEYKELLKKNKSRYSLPIDSSQVISSTTTNNNVSSSTSSTTTTFDLPSTPMTISTTTTTTTTTEFDPEIVIKELLEALEELRKEHSKTIDELFELKMDKQDVESERDALKLTILELERKYHYTQQDDPSPIINQNNHKTTSLCISCSNHINDQTNQKSLSSSLPPFSPLPQSSSTTTATTTTAMIQQNHHTISPYMDDMLSIKSQSDLDNEEEEESSTSSLSLSTNKTIATTINSDEENEIKEIEFLRTELVKTKVENFEKQQHCEKLELEVDNLQSRLDMMNEGQLNLADKLVAMKSDMDELLQKMKQRDLEWNDLKKENDELTKKLKLNQTQLTNNNNNMKDDEPFIKKMSPSHNNHDDDDDSHSLKKTNNVTVGRSGSLYGRMWHAFTPKSNHLKATQQ
ncbi:unnamed protein product [Cunninghamella blakesleeana]